MKHYLHLVLTAIMLLCFGGVVDAQTTETYTFSTFTSSKSVSLTGTNCKITLAKGSGGSNPAYVLNEARLYATGSITVSSETKKISKVVYNYKENANKKGVVPTILSVTPNGFDEATKTWTSTEGSNSVMMTLGGTAGNFGFTSLEITYIDEAEPTEPTLTFGDYNNKTIEKHVGDDNFTITASLKPSVEGATITYSSSNENVAIVDENTGEVVVGDEGTSIITAKYVDANTKEQTASYTLNVTKVPTTLSFGAEYDGKTITKKIGDDIFNVTAVLTPNIEGATISYESSDDNVATVNDNGDVLIGKTIGTAKITANYAGNDTYAAASASYTISVIDPNSNLFDFKGANDYGSGVEKTSESSYYVTEDKTWVSGNVTMVTSGKYRWWKNTNALRFYGGSFTLTVPEGYHITNVVLTGTDKFDANLDSYKDGKWIGNANSVKFTSTDNGKDLKSITVTYAPDATLTTAASSFATYSCDYAVDYSAAGLKAYAVKLDEANNKVVYTEINGTVAAATPVLLQGEASTQYTLAPSTAEATTVDTDLKMSDGSVVAADNLYYGFATVNGISGFKLVQNGVTIPAKKGYLKLTNAISDAKAFYAFNGETTGINEAVSENNFDENAPRYNVSGQRVDKSFKGLVIINGKKYILK